MKVKVVIADDHSMIREALKQLLELENDIHVVATADNGEKALEMIGLHKPHIVLLDINMPVLDGISTLREIKNSKSKLMNSVKVIMLTVHKDSEHILKAVDIGCDGYVLKEASCEILKEAILSVYNGKKYIQADIIPLLNSNLAKRDSNEDIIQSLTKREKQILKLLGEGKSNKEISAVLDISDKTVKNHITHLLKKIDVDDRTQAAVFAVKNGLVNI